VTAVPPGADCAQLSGAYADSGKFEDRRSIYDCLRPRRDFIGWALSHLRVENGDCIVDVGCGPGHFLRRLTESKPSLRLVGVDLSIGMAREARRAGCPVTAASADAVPLPAACCDAVLAMHMLYHVPDIELAVRELRRVLRPGGVLLASTIGPGHLAKLRQLADAPVGDRLPRPSDRFSLENGASQLQRAFSSIHKTEVGGDVILTEPEPGVAFIASGRDFYEPLLPADVTWDHVIDHVESALAQEISERGEMRIGTQMGVFVCR
jgi:SAM-dependent methyltransferase